MRSYYQKELAQKGVGDMTYLLRNEEVRFDPSRLVEGARSVLVFAFNYFPPIRQESVCHKWLTLRMARTTTVW